jgi:hypothetical protein
MQFKGFRVWLGTYLLGSLETAERGNVRNMATRSVPDNLPQGTLPQRVPFFWIPQGIFVILCVAASQQGLQPCSGWSPNLSGVPSPSKYQTPSFFTSSL